MAGPLFSFDALRRALPSAERYACFRDDVYSSALHEPELPLGLVPMPPEQELQSRWFAGEFGRDFTTTDGRKVEIVQFGCWNHAAGPDFCDAVIRLDGEKRAGPIELDPDARDWENHGHAINPAYDSVILHLFVTAPDASRKYFTRTASHREVPQVVLDLATLAPGRPKFLQAEARVGRCAFPLRDLPAPKLDALMVSAAQYRLRLKAKRFHRVAEIHGFDEAWFQALAEALGYANNKLPMRVLAQRLPLAQLRTFPDIEAEAVLFGAAGFLGQPSFETAAPDARPYLRELWESWWKRRDGFARTLQWKLSGTRPVNHPQRRVGALAALVRSWDRVAAPLKATTPFVRKAFENAFAALEHPYWSHHYTLNSKAAPRPMLLVGKSRVADILANIVVPARIGNEPALWDLYRKLRAELDNHKVRRARQRLFAAQSGDPTEKWLYQQQALLQIYDDFCLADDSDCADCPFPEQLRQWE